MENETIFHKILRKEIPSHMVYEDDQVYAFMDVFPVARGHVLVIPKKAEGENLLSVSVATMAPVFAAVQSLLPRVVAAVGADSAVVSMNNGAAAGQTVFYPHVHIIPRFENDGHEPWPKLERSGEELAQDAEAIKAELAK